jgi:hypothetical protein
VKEELVTMEGTVVAVVKNAMIVALDAQRRGLCFSLIQVHRP